MIKIYRSIYNDHYRVVEAQDGALYGFSNPIEEHEGLEEIHWTTFTPSLVDARGELLRTVGDDTLQRKFDIVESAAVFWKEQAIMLGYEE